MFFFFNFEFLPSFRINQNFYFFIKYSEIVLTYLNYECPQIKKIVTNTIGNAAKKL